MSRKTVILCDHCGEKTTEDGHLCCSVGRKADAAGSMDDVTDSVDLCLKCAIHFLRKHVTKTIHGNPAAFMNGMKSKGVK